MIDFWMATGLLLVVALSFLLIPLLRGHRAQREEDRTALNVALYQERLNELQVQQEQGVLSVMQLQAARAEAARELLADTEGAEPDRTSRLGKPLLVLAALLVPMLGLAGYLQLGASDRVELSREFARPPTSLADMTQRLERSVQAQPDSAENLYFLARSYMAQNRPGDAAQMFERSVALAGRQPELLGQWAQALYFASDKHFTPQVQALTDEALQADPREVTSLGLLGIAAFETQRYQAAVDYWTRLLAALPADDASRSALEGGIARARDSLAKRPANAAPAPAVKAKSIKIHVELAAALQGKVRPNDSVFIFARAINGPAAPLAVKRITVADLPADVELSDSDAMMPQLNLSNFAQVQLVARVSRAGQPTTGEWVGRSQPLASDSGVQQALTIDSPDN
ncbi:c-type cytochrome biogenesis protein CcmI [Pseudomonas fragariae (ex Marin et al. 2024)]|uniref:C-type cytochrome biogenesis protein CcmI n=2 Tax=Pseudomonas syringae TaxID=317 RepID=A0AAJ4AZQ9_PSESX|nr:c-type cytochrome biogenesis protein CcmI [Pseudomonas syringae]AKF46961.1 cytochrome c-type biogenesis protein CcmI [Pseudomonas syringae pv. syringae B301D]EXL31955.1 Cytochrome c-type biogenesis protein CcmI, apo-cytochrome chaperone [Pseudomonas syringae pv. syringae str. B301D-R]MCH5509290.1 c-type cytochrome biogenesis protein CcmI [Pseudomonas syringae pv. syringae]MCH5639576.1 c-type cytochrome biogenesis protein CcmI [Pseudomonas syringae pv. syringae]MCH7427612.1 c-type cytochrome